MSAHFRPRCMTAVEADEEQVQCGIRYRETRTCVHSGRHGILAGSLGATKIDDSWRAKTNDMAYPIGSDLGPSGGARSQSETRKRLVEACHSRWSNAASGRSAGCRCVLTPKRAQVRTNERLTSRGDRTDFYNSTRLRKTSQALLSGCLFFKLRRRTVLVGLLYLLCDML